MHDLLDRCEVETPVAGEDDRPLFVPVLMTDLLAQFREDMRAGFERVERGVDAANSALALKADKTDLERLRTDTARRLDKHDEEIGALQVVQGSASGWRTGFFVAVGIVLGAAPMAVQAITG